MDKAFGPDILECSDNEGTGNHYDAIDSNSGDNELVINIDGANNNSGWSVSSELITSK